MIGITFGNNKSMFCDGMRIHCFVFYKQLSHLNMEPYFICTDDIAKWFQLNHPDIHFITYSSLTNPNIIQKVKTIIEWEVFLPNPLPFITQKYNIKVIRMNCGNTFHSTHMRFLENKNIIYPNASYIDEHWCSPQHNHCVQLKQHMYNKPIITIPYIYNFTK